MKKGIKVMRSYSRKNQQPKRLKAASETRLSQTQRLG